MPLAVGCITNDLYPEPFCAVQYPTVLPESDLDNGYFIIEYISGTLWFEYDGWENENYWPDPLPNDYYSITDNQFLIQVILICC